MIHKLDIGSKKDRNEIIELQKASYLIEASWINCYDIPGLLDDDSKLLESKETFYGYRIDGMLEGIISYRILDNTLDIHRVAVDPKYFNRGIASDMIKHVENKVGKIERIIVSTGKENYPACRLYKKLGFDIVGETDIAEGLKIVNFEKKIM